MIEPVKKKNNIQGADTTPGCMDIIHGSVNTTSSVSHSMRVVSMVGDERIKCVAIDVINDNSRCLMMKQTQVLTRLL